MPEHEIGDSCPEKHPPGPASIARIAADEHKGLSLDDALINIQSKDSCRDSALGCHGFNDKSFQSEVICPRLLAGIE
jgi:hypothetical protein